jgi:hypothetical protein
MKSIYSLITEAANQLNDSITSEYSGFEVLNFETKETTKHPYLKGKKAKQSEDEAIAGLMKSTGLARNKFAVNGFIKK